MDDQGAIVQLFEMEQSLEETEEPSAAATMLDESAYERDTDFSGEENLERFADRIAAPDRSHPVDFGRGAIAAGEGGYELPDVFAPPTPAEREREELLKALLASPAITAVRAALIASATGAEAPPLHFRKMRGMGQLFDWVKSMVAAGHSVESLARQAREGGDPRAASFIEDCGRELGLA